MQKLILQCDLPLGDVVLMTAAVRDLHRAFPGEFQTDVRTPFPELWTHNPYLTPLTEYAPGVGLLVCRFELVQQSNYAGLHCLHAFLHDLSRHLGLAVPLTEFRGDTHLSAAERSAPCLAHRRLGARLPFWLISSGGKTDYTAKWWDPRRYQEVVDHFRGRILFVQVGDLNDHHPLLQDVLDLRGQTSVRELVRLVHHAQGVLCGVTGLMHLAAAVPPPTGQPGARPCVVVAGGREPPAWEAYPGHQFIHTVGALPCCTPQACWRSHTLSRWGGDPKDHLDEICLNPRGLLPACMDLITSAEVVRRVESYFEGGVCRYLTPAEAGAAARALTGANGPWQATKGRRGLAERALPSIPPGETSCTSPKFPGRRPARPEPLNVYSAPAAAAAFIERMPPCPEFAEERGIVICGGGVRMFTNAWVCLRMLRRLGCSLPIELWHYGEREMDDTMRALVAPYGVRCVDAARVAESFPAPALNPWVLKPFALLHARFRQVLLLDADNVPVRNPEYLFDAAPFRRTGAVFWPDYEHLAPNRTAWLVFDVPYRDEPEVESGQVLVDKARCWRPLRLAVWYNEHARFFYQHVFGDKETFHLAWRRLGVPYAMPPRPIRSLPGAMCHHDFQGRRLFQHRNTAKWRLFGGNARVPGFRWEKECLGFLRELGQRWNGRVTLPPRPDLPPPTMAGHGGEDGDSQNSSLRLKHRGGTSSTSPKLSDRSPRPSPRPPWALAEVRLVACMVSCEEREVVRRQTLARLARTDWGDRPMHVQVDARWSNDRLENIAHTAWQALQAALQSPWDYVLYLEDDLEFNRHLYHNLMAWPRLRARQLTLATLYNAGQVEIGWDVPPRAFAFDGRQLMGAQALLLARPTVKHLLEHWFEGPRHVDRRIGTLAAGLNRPIFCHTPSLVQHVGRHSIWGCGFHQASDFDPHWKAPAL